MAFILRTLSPSFWVERYRKVFLRLEELEKRLEQSNEIIDLILSREICSNIFERGLNSQDGRKKIVKEVFDLLEFQQIIETGTYFGLTTGYLNTTFKLPVFTCETIKRHYLIANYLLKGMSEVRVELNDSCSFLTSLSRDEDVIKQNTFFYLDAHWFDYLPLNEEINLICQSWKRFVILIDDFCVPNDAGYGYDNYGQGKSLDLGYLDACLKRYSLNLYFPNLDSQFENGKKRGCVFLVPDIYKAKFDSLHLVKACPYVAVP